MVLEYGGSLQVRVVGDQRSRFDNCRSRNDGSRFDNRRSGQNRLVVGDKGLRLVKGMGEKGSRLDDRRSGDQGSRFDNSRSGFDNRRSGVGAQAGAVAGVQAGGVRRRVGGVGAV